MLKANPILKGEKLVRNPMSKISAATIFERSAAVLPPKMPKKAARVIRQGIISKAATILGKTRYAFVFIPIISRASICSETRTFPKFVRNDDSNDGRTIKRTLLFFSDDEEEDEKKLKSGDNVRVEMLCISYPVYKYWYSLAESSTGEGQSVTPGNPVTNISGGALGYLSAHTIQSKTVIVP